MSTMVFFWLTSLLPGAGPSASADIIIRGATLYDGSGTPSRKGDLAIRGERIVAIDNIKSDGHTKIIDATGLVASPGFIDLHNHSDVSITLPATRSNLCYLMQGVTTIVTGNCGAGPTDVAAFFKKLTVHPPGTHVIHLFPHNDLRSRVLGNANRMPTAAELMQMESLLDRGMQDGAWGLSTGLIYNPGAYSKTDELVMLARVAGRHGGIYASHIRDEGAALLASVDEALTIGREAGLPVHISHLKASGPAAWGKAADAIVLIAKARASGQKVTADQYPYTASSTSLAALVVPPHFRAGSPQDFRARLEDPEQGPRIRQAIQELIGGREGARRLKIANYRARPAWQGKDLDAIAAGEKKSALDVVLEIEGHGGAIVINFAMTEEEVRLIMEQPFVATASDGYSQVPAVTMAHPRSYGCFPRKVGRYAVVEKVLSLEQAIRSATGLPADILQLSGRGYLKAGYYADIVLFDPATFRDVATYERPHQFATGVHYLFVNGSLVIDRGQFTRVLVGKPLRHTEK